MTEINEAATFAADSTSDSKQTVSPNENSRHVSDFSVPEEADITETRPNPGQSQESDSSTNISGIVLPLTPTEEEERRRLSIEDSASEEDVTDEHSNNTPLVIQFSSVEQPSNAGSLSISEHDSANRGLEEEDGSGHEENQEQREQSIPDEDNRHTNDARTIHSAADEPSIEVNRTEAVQEQAQQSVPAIVAPEPIYQLGLGPTDTYSPVSDSTATTTSSTQNQRSGTNTNTRGRSVSNVTPSTFHNSYHSSSNNNSNSTTTAQATPNNTGTLPPRSQRVWEMDRQAPECRRCNRKFNFLVRRHHCRRCGQIVCDKCSSNRLRLPVEELIEDPMISLSQYPSLASQYQRVCDTCYREPIRRSSESSTFYYSSSNGGGGGGHRSRTYYGSPSRSRTVPSMRQQQQQQQMQRTDSSQSLMIDCPVCGNSFLGMQKVEQEEHLKQCLNVGSPPVHAPRYIVYKLKEGTTQIGDECPICFDEFEEGDKIARMICLCTYHQRCLSSWLQRGKGCPVHYDSLQV